MNKAMNETRNNESDNDYSNPPIIRANQALADEVELLSKYVSTLEDRLSAVLYSEPVTPKETPDTEAEESISSPLGSFIQKQTGFVRSSRIRLMGLVDRLEI